MRKLRNILTLTAMVLLITDSKTAYTGAKEGIDLCIQSVIPSLFPFLLISIMFTSGMADVRFPPLKGICKLCKIPDGCESILMMMVMGGYPVGAQAVADAWKKGSLDTNSAKRLLGFCNNAGPSFIFGIVGSAFTVKTAAWALWLIQILSAIIVGALLADEIVPVVAMEIRKQESVTSAISKAVHSMTYICAWVVVFRILLAFGNKYIFFFLPVNFQILVSGILELTNGCLMLSQIHNEALRFMIASVMLSAGGLCVFLQTRSVTGCLGTGKYFPGKLLQTGISLILSSATAIALYHQSFVF